MEARFADSDVQIVAGAVESLLANTGGSGADMDGGGGHVPVGEELGEEGAGDAQAPGQMGGAGGVERRGEGHGRLGRWRCAPLRAWPVGGERIAAIRQGVGIRSRPEMGGGCIRPRMGWRLRGRGLFLAWDSR